jgi:hypothetical protein
VCLNKRAKLLLIGHVSQLLDEQHMHLPEVPASQPVSQRAIQPASDPVSTDDPLVGAATRPCDLPAGEMRQRRALHTVAIRDAGHRARLHMCTERTSRLRRHTVDSSGSEDLLSPVLGEIAGTSWSGGIVCTAVGRYATVGGAGDRHGAWRLARR